MGTVAAQPQCTPRKIPCLGKVLHARDPAGKFGRQQSVVGGFDGQFAHGGDPHVDGNGAESARLPSGAPGAHGRLCKAGPGIPALPGEELVQPEIVNAAGDRGRDAVEQARSSFSK